MNKLYFSTGFALFLFGLFFMAPAARAAIVPMPCAGGSAKVVDVTQHIMNDPDSAVSGGSWALDTFDRHIQIWQDNTNPSAPFFCGQANDSGTFVTFGGASGKSPQSGAPLPEVVTGTIFGGTFGTITGTLKAPVPALPAIDCKITPAICSAGLISYFVNNYFTGGVYDYSNNWNWTYDGGANGIWVNSNAGNTGDIIHIATPVCDSSKNKHDNDHSIQSDKCRINDHDKDGDKSKGNDNDKDKKSNNSHDNYNDKSNHVQNGKNEEHRN